MEGLRITFGHVIAFFLPGIVTTRAVAYFFPTIQTALDSLISGVSGALGQTVFLAGIAATTGLATSAIRGQYLDEWFGRFMCRHELPSDGPPRWKTDYGQVKAVGLEMWEKTVENVFRYYQFTANLSIAIMLLFAARLLTNGIAWDREFRVTLAVLGVSILLLVTAYRQFRGWCNVKDSVLRPAAGSGPGITQTGAAQAATSTGAAAKPTSTP